MKSTQRLKRAFGNNAHKIRRMIFKGKKRFHKEQAGLSFAEKIRILVDLQRLVQKIKRSDNYVWRI